MSIELVQNSTLTDWISAGASVLTFLVAGYAVFYARGQVREARESREQAKALDTARSQPYVSVYMESSQATPSIIEFVVKNFGTTSASNIEIQVEPELLRTTNGGEAEPLPIPEKIATLAPQQEWRTIWDVAHDRLPNKDIPDLHQGRVTYDGIDDAHLSAPFALDWGLYRERSWVRTYGAHDAAKAMREIRDTLKKWNESVKGPLAVTVRNGDTKDEQRRQERDDYLRPRHPDGAT